MGASAAVESRHVLRHRTCLILGSCVLAVLAGCANLGNRGSAQPRIEEVGLPQSLGPKQGLLLLKLDSNVVSDDDKVLHWSALDVYRVADHHPVRIAGTRIGLEQSIAFVAALDAGEYSLVQVDSAGSGRTAPLNRWQSTFTVVPGRLTNLGTLVFQPNQNGNLEVGARFYFGLERNSAETLRYLSLIAPQLASTVREHPVEWNQIDQLQPQRKIAAIIRNLAIGNGSPAEAKDGSVYTAGLLGVIRRRRPSGHWVQYDTGFTDDLTCVAALADTSIIAGGEAELLVRSIDKGRTWKRIAAPSVASSIYGLGQLPNNSVYALVGNGDRAQIFLAANAASPAWKPIGDFPLPSTRSPQFRTVRQVRVLTIRGRLAAFIPPQTLALYAPERNAWDQQSLPYPFITVSADRKGSIYATEVQSATRTEIDNVMSISSDLGRTWQTSAPFNARHELRLMPGTGLVYRVRENVISESPYKAEDVLSVSNDRGGNWRDIGPYALGRGIFFQTQAGMLLDLFGNGAFSSNDSGKTWTRELEQTHPPLKDSDGDDAPPGAKDKQIAT